MAYPVTELIADSYYLSRVVSQGFEEVTGYQMSKGLRLLKGAIAFKTAENRTIPYFKQYNFDGIVGEEKYFIPGLIQIETLTFNIDQVRYQMESETRQRYFGSSRANNINSLPYMYFMEKCLNGANLYIYFLPQQAYPFEIHGKFRLENDLTLAMDLETIFDDFYIQYLKYLLSEYICEDYQIQTQPEVRRRLISYEKSLFDTSAYDLSMIKTSNLQSSIGSPDIYAQANLGKGWTTP